jgi:hypothetical protein
MPVKEEQPYYRLKDIRLLYDTVFKNRVKRNTQSYVYLSTILYEGT